MQFKNMSDNIQQIDGASFLEKNNQYTLYTIYNTYRITMNCKLLKCPSQSVTGVLPVKIHRVQGTDVLRMEI